MRSTRPLSLLPRDARAAQREAGYSGGEGSVARPHGYYEKNTLLLYMCKTLI